MAPQTIIIMGRSGSGKGTQAERLAAELKRRSAGRDVFYLESGERFREFITRSSYSARLSKAVMEAGELQPAFLAIWNWSHLLVDRLTGEEHLLIDGTPRMLIEAQVLDDALRFYGREPLIFIYLNISKEEAMKRLLLRARDDDQSTAKINQRLAWFEREVLPVIEHYRSKPETIFLEVDGQPPIEMVAAEILAKLTPYWE
jgi:adenylate kinase family enzyme